MSRKDEIVRRAALLFDAKGYHETTIEDIANDIGMKKGSLYYYIESKEDLLYEIHDQFITRLLSRVESQVNNEEDCLEKLRRLVHEHAHIMHQYNPQIRVFFREFHALPPDKKQLIIVKRNRYEDILLQILREGMASGVFRRDDERIVAFGILGMLNYLFQWYSPDGRLSISEIAEIFMSIISRGLTVPEGDAQPGT